LIRWITGIFYLRYYRYYSPRHNAMYTTRHPTINIFCAPLPLTTPTSLFDSPIIISVYLVCDLNIKINILIYFNIEIINKNEYRQHFIYRNSLKLFYFNVYDIIILSLCYPHCSNKFYLKFLF